MTVNRYLALAPLWTALTLATLWSVPALAAELTVNDPGDSGKNGDGLVTLREALIAANTDGTTDLGQTGSGVDSIVFDATVFGSPQTITLARSTRG